MKRETIQQENYNYKRIFPAVFFCALLFIGLFFAAPPALASHFTITALPLSGIIDQGEQVSFTATATCVSVPCGEISFSINGLPIGASASFLIGSCVPNCSTFVTINSGSASYGFYTINVRGTDAAADFADSSLFNLTIGYNIKGWAWSDGIGWISFNSENCDTNWNGIMDVGDIPPPQCPSLGTTIPQYGAHLDLGTFVLSGYAWSEHIGWITFDKSVAGIPPAAPFDDNLQNYIARYNLTNGMIEGWARAASCPDTSCDANSQWGWIKMSNPVPKPAPNFGAHYTSGGTNNEFDGFAWGGSVMSWISFNSKNCDTDNDGFWDACDLSGTAYPYKVWINGALPNGLPMASDLSVSFDDRCGAPFNPKFTFTYRDPVEEDPLAQYTIRVYEQSSDVLINTIFVPAQFDVFGNVVPIAPHASPASFIYPGTNANLLSYGKTYYFTVTVQDKAHLGADPLSLPVFSSVNFKTDPHQRPYISGITWQPPAYFAGDPAGVTFTPSVKVYTPATDPGDLTANQPILSDSDENAYTSLFSWKFATSSTDTNPISADNFSPSRVFNYSGKYNISLTVADATGDVCGPDSNELCECALNDTINPFNVSKPKPYFKEIKP